MKKSIIDNIRDFNRYYTNLIGVLNKDALQLNYSLTELRVVYEISNGSAISAKDITAILSLDEGYTSRIVAKLIKDEIISREKDVNDKRLFLLRLLPKGVELAQVIEKRSDEQIEQLLKDLTEDEVARFSELTSELKRLLAKRE
nr:MarR family transcriptional regulator [uncultured Flavobacterium sp.]